MKNTCSSILLIGIAGGLICWSLYELFLFIIAPLLLSTLTLSLLGGAFSGILAGFFVGGTQGYLKHSLKKIKRNALVGSVAGGFAGLLSSYIITYIDSNILIAIEGVNITAFIPLLRWGIIALFIGIAIGVSEKGNIEISRELLSAFTVAILCTAIMFLLSHRGLGSFLERGVAFITICSTYAYFLLRFSTLKRKEWIKSLNGKLSGIEFELSKEALYLGTQQCDDINLNAYEKVNPAHAKLIKYYTGYSLTDNDPFGLTYVNFRNIKEQPLKNGDILKIGSALFQYCRNNV